MARHLMLQFEAPLMAFGGVLIDNYGRTRDFPAASMLTGLLANALGWQRQDRKEHQELQNRLVFAAGIVRESDGGVLQDTQNARLHQKDQAWTTSGVPQGRETSPSYKGVDSETPQRGKYLLQRRYRDYLADARILVALRLVPPAVSPTLEQLCRALLTPARPLFLGRKACAPSRPLLPAESARWIEADSAYDALCLSEEIDETCRALWPETDGPEGERRLAICDERDWLAGLHGGTRYVRLGRTHPPEVKESS